MARGGKWVECTPGEELDPVEFVFTPQRVQYFAEGVEDFHPWIMYDIEDSPFGGPIISPTMSHITKLIAQQNYFTDCNVDSGFTFRMHTQYTAEHFDAIRVGEKCTVKAKILDSYYKRGRHYIDHEMIIYGEDGRKCVRHTSKDVLSFIKKKEDE